MTFDDRSVSTVKDQTLTCSISGLSQDSPVTWIGPDNQDVTVSDPSSYIVKQGNFESNGKESTLTIDADKFLSLRSGDVFKCTLRSSLYPDSPEMVKEMTLTLLRLCGLLLWHY